MKKQIIIITLLYAFTFIMSLGSETNFDKIVLTPYIESNTIQNGASHKLLVNKLNQAVLKCGLAGQGINDRFIITAHASELELVSTPTRPVKYALRILLTIYVGDGIDGSLYSSYGVELKGIGSSVDDAYLSAYRKLKINDPELLNSIEVGRRRVIEYYNEHSAHIISHAKALASSGDYDQAIYQLFLIPPMCYNYDEAQNLAGDFAAEALDKYNEQVIAEARAAWSSSPNVSGASQARSILSKISNPSNTITYKVEQLTQEMAERIEHVEDMQMKHEQQMEQNRHAETMAQIKADERNERARIKANERNERARIKANSRENVARIKAARDVAVSYYKSRPRVVYHYHWW